MPPQVADDELDVWSTEAGGSKATWIKNMFRELPGFFPKVRALIWFEGPNLGPGGHHDWMVESFAWLGRRIRHRNP